MSSWQVFGLTGYLLAPASQSMTEPVLLWSFRSCSPLRGSSGVSPDSLFSLISRSEHHEVKPTLSWINVGVNHNILGGLCKSWSFVSGIDQGNFPRSGHVA